MTKKREKPGPALFATNMGAHTLHETEPESNKDFHKATRLRNDAKALRDRQYLNKNRLEHLKRTLAEARMMVLSGLLPDNSVAMDRYLK